MQTGAGKALQLQYGVIVGMSLITRHAHTTRKGNCSAGVHKHTVLNGSTIDGAMRESQATRLASHVVPEVNELLYCMMDLLYM